MNLKSKIISTLALLGVISCTSVYGTEITSVFSGETISRDNIQNISLTSELTTDTILGISKTRENGNWYVWNPTADAIDDNTGELIVDEDGNVQAKKVWKIAKYSSEISNVRDYSNLYYCLNAERGFGLTDGEMAEGKKDIYSDSYDMKDSTKNSQITTLAGGNLGTNYNKILWILENSYIPTGYEDYQSTSEYKKLMNAANISIDSEDERLNLTEDDIEVVQQMAIWYFTNSENNVYHNSNLPSLYLDGKQLTSLYFETDEYGSQITGAHRQNKAELLYKYYIESATSSFSPVIPTLTLSNSEVKVKESGNNYVVGPFLLTGTNTDLIKEISTEVNVNYTLLDSSKNVVANNDFSKVIGNNGFYLQISKANITEDTQIDINLNYKYDVRELILLTNKDDATGTQPVVLVKTGEIDPTISTTANIELVNINGTKTWVDYNNKENTRPNSITVNLLANGTKVKDVVVTSNDDWKYEFNNLIKYDENNELITYTVTEDPVEEYTTTIDGYNITNVYTTTTSVNGTKTWVDYNNKENTRPNSITVNLLADGTKVQDTIVTAKDNWAYSFANLPKYNENNELITYTVTEDPVEEYTTTIDGYNITNVYTTTTSVNGTKTWVDYNNKENTRPNSITVNLLANGTKVKDVVVTSNDDWKYEFNNLIKYDENNELITYTVTEDPVEKYATTIDGYNITNVYTTTTSVNGTKTWVDYNNKENTRPNSITVNLLANGTKVKDVVVTSNDDWKYEFNNLIKYDENNELITYTVTEDPVEEYTTTIDGYNITNVYTTTTSVNGTKTWVDYNNKENTRPNSITVNLLANGTKVKDVVVTSNDDWKYEFNNLIKYDENNELITYTVTEDPVEKYATTIDGYNITNVYTTTTSVNGTKTWVDYNNKENTRPNSITVNLLANGTKVKDVVVTSNDDWKYEFNNLIKYDENNELITYTVTEDPVEKYATTIDGYNITNVYTTTTSVNGTKTWVDYNNKENTRPKSITVNLLADGTKVQDTIVTAKDNWAYSFANLPKYNENNELITYTVTEDPVEEYTTTIEGNDITNTYVPKKVNKTVIKVWEDGNDADGIRPEEITVKLYKLENGQEFDVDTQVLNDSNNWTYTWSGLDQKSNGEDIVYGIKEIDTVQVYTTTYSAEDYSNTDTITITNTHISKDLAIQLQKVDELGVVITSSEAEFDITGSQELKEETDKGILNLDSQKLVGNNFEFIYTINENKAPIGYNGLSEELSVKITGTTKIENSSYVIDTINITDENGNELDNEKVLAEYDAELNKVVIKIVNTKIENAYSVKLLKVGEDGKTTLEGAWFKVNDGQPIRLSKDGNEIATGKLNNKGTLKLTYKLEETIAPEGYIKIQEPIEVKISATVDFKDNEYQITEVKLLEELDGITIDEDNNVITIKVENEVEITGKYNVVLRKVDENGNILNGSTFKIGNKVYELPTGEATILENRELLSTDAIELSYTIKETTIPEGYVGIEDTTIYIKGTVEKQGNNYKLVRANLVDSKGNSVNNDNISLKVEKDTIVIVVKNSPIEKKFDLALRKFITKINDIEYSREPIVDTSTIDTTGTATYKHTKQPIAVQKGDIVTYTIRVYNEGELDGYVDKITDHLPDHLLPIIVGTDGIDEEKYSDEIDFNLNWGWIISEDGKSVTTMKTSKINSETYSLLEGFEDITDTKLNAYVEGSNKLDYIDVQIKCLVTDSATSSEYLTNIAEITDAQDINGKHWDGIDSELSNAVVSNLNNYKNTEAINSTENSYIEGQEDDDDFEKLVVKEFDLALRKFITKVNEVLHARVPVVDTSKLGTVVNGKTITTAEYNHTKEPVIVETDDIVTYTIRIYNEGTLDGFANEITDDIPKGLEFLPNSDVNILYKWKMLDAEGNQTEDVSKAVMIVTDYLSDADSNNIINAVSEKDGVKTLSYKDVEVQFKVIAKPEKLKDNLIINEAQISADSDRDIDSIPNRNEKYDYDFDTNEDDIDYEPIKLQYFDLALRKFITKVNSTDYNNRYPEVVYNEDGSITYNHTKDPVLVTTGDIVTYTIRVYNEGEKAGYATEIKDNLPDGLAFDPENETNKQYGWKMLDSEGNVTEDASKVVAFSTDYLKDDLIDALVIEESQKMLSYKDVKIAFKVVEPNTSDRILVNTAQILSDSDDDIDSIPGNDVLTEDDIDKEYVKVQYFDLALKKWVTATKVTYNGKTTTTKTGFTEDSEGIAKVDLVASKLNKTTVKFVYSIKVINQGELPGYANEVKDYIPKGLKFVAADNKDWKELEDGQVVTDKLKDTLLNPGESATVEIVLTWKNSATNLGLKTNYAEISKDSSDDIDSTPDNYDFTEDDIDDAQVLLSIKTAGATTYVGLILAIVTILAGGTFLIKKYVID